MELVLLILLVLVVLALVGGIGGPTIYRRTRRPVVRETVYEDDPVVVEEVVDETPGTRTRRRIVDY